MKNVYDRKWLALGFLGLALVASVLIGRVSAQPAHAADEMGRQLNLISTLLKVIDDFRKIAESPTGAGVAAVMGVEDRVGNPNEAIAFLEKTLPQVKDESVRRAIRIQLAEFYKKTNQREKSLDQLQRLMTGNIAP